MGSSTFSNSTHIVVKSIETVCFGHQAISLTAIWEIIIDTGKTQQIICSNITMISSRLLKMMSHSKNTVRFSASSPLKKLNFLICLVCYYYCHLSLFYTLYSISVAELAQLGTYAGNDTIVAFARLYQVKLCLFQLKQIYDNILKWKHR